MRQENDMNASDTTDGELDPYTFGPDQRCFGCGPHNAR